MIRGVTVTVYQPVRDSVDRFGNSTYTERSFDVDNVLIVPGATADLEASRPEGVEVSFTLHFPKTFTGDLEGCSVEIPNNGRFKVVGAPKPYMDVNTPTPWHMPVEVAAAHG